MLPTVAVVLSLCLNVYLTWRCWTLQEQILSRMEDDLSYIRIMQKANEIIEGMTPPESPHATD